MSFASSWLALREPADAAARDRGLIAALAEWTAGRPLAATDLGCGTGSTVRALAPLVPSLRWTLVDNDPALLAEAAARTGAATRALDLAAGPEAAVEGAQVVAASALFDLVSDAWLRRFAAALSPEVAVYAALSYDGRESWSPAPPHEAQALAAFRRHQTGDKGFGPALGSNAGAALAALLAARGWRVRVADSAWRLGPGDGPLIRALADGSAEAVAETGALAGRQLAEWRAARRAARQVEIGHLDLLALPPEN
ncbi:class I SAM-dependent methyltransferase [Albimonas sp. CAU 1670]|uniref:methyltransferase domain-containing protein n=1 Tax=Albimonas sp. CAU 1670 TaxID=3032599 RepID=UPI0023DC73C4|nr:class I SAM-dependent methyltransferase [Albimonas sp. CAU 1670]MDF2232032.1 class I SAM-dependent methyltransferase [Albimonas sp. CAU 1670]